MSDEDKVMLQVAMNKNIVRRELRQMVKKSVGWFEVVSLTQVLNALSLHNWHLDVVDIILNHKSIAV